MGSTLGAIKSAATKIGVTAEEYIRRRDAGERWCWACGEWHPLSEFGSNRSVTDGVQRQCRAAQRTTKVA
jgi:hypothetical protein